MQKNITMQVACQDMYGWKARVGLIVPSTNTVNESEFAQYLPNGVSVHPARMLLTGGADADSLASMKDHRERCANELQTADVDIVVYGCTTGGLDEGPAYERDVERQLGEIADAPVVHAGAALGRALDALNLDSIALATPYTDELTDLEESHFEDQGYDVVATENLGFTDPKTLGSQTPEDAYRVARAADRPNADGIVVSCTDFRTLPVIDALERDTGKPVISSNSATLWNLFEKVRVDPVNVPLGSLGPESLDS